jgi:membrane protein required for colicin V production
MGWFDIAILLVILLSGLISLVRGFVKESISLATWLAAGFIALSYHPVLSEMLLPYLESPTISLAAAFAALFVATLIVGAIINFMVSQLVSKTGLSGTDKTLGVVFGIARGVLIIALLVLFAELTPIPEERWWQESTMVEHFTKVAVWIRDLLPADVAERFKL